MKQTTFFDKIWFKVLFPWVLLIVCFGGLIVLKVLQERAVADQEEHAAWHRESILLCVDLRYLAHERFSAALRFVLQRGEIEVLRVTASEDDTAAAIQRLSLVGSGESHQEGLDDNFQDRLLLESYEFSRQGLPELYQQLINAVRRGEAAHAEQLVRLISDKFDLTRAALADLVAYHTATASLVEAGLAKAKVVNDVWFFSLLSLLGFAGLLLSWFQAMQIARPLRRLTRAVAQFEVGESLEIDSLARKGEIDDLAQAFSSMVARTNRYNLQILEQKLDLEQTKADIERTVLRRTAELEQANADLKSFSYSVSHDLRAPLRAIDGFLGILQEDHMNRFNGEILRLFEVVRQNARKMGELIDDILSFSRAGQMAVVLQPVNMERLVDECWQSLEPQWKDRPVTFRVDNLPPCEGDVRALRQVWINLLSNALKFSRDRNPAQIEVEATVAVDKVVYRVRDNGVGFDPAYRDKLFGIFQRLHGQEEFEGTGIGLALVKRFVALHGGKVDAVSEPGKGAMFSFELPLAPQGGFHG